MYFHDFQMCVLKRGVFLQKKISSKKIIFKNRKNGQKSSKNTLFSKNEN